MATGDLPPRGHDAIEDTSVGPPSSRREAAPAALIVYERGRAELVEIPFGRHVTLGREPPADILVVDRSISRQHARFGWKGDDLYVDDLGSKNGTQVGQKRVQTERLKSGDIVRLGGITVSVHVVRSALRGIDTYDSLLTALDNELARARHFGRSFALIALRARKPSPDGHVSRFCPRVRTELGDIDRLATYSAESALALLPEVDVGRAREVASVLVRPHTGEPPLTAGIAVYPASGISAAEIVAAAQEAALRAAADGAVTVHEARGAAEVRSENGIVVASPRMRELHAIVRRVAKAPVPVLLLGETGVGKEVIATEIHSSSGRQGPLQMINCAAIPANLTESTLFGHERGAFTGADRAAKGLFEEAHGGTLLLDEVGELPPAAQAALLRVLESKQVVRVGSAKEIAVDVRVIAATHRDLEAMVASGTFRSDLLFRLNAITLSVPPLRERREEIPELARLFVRAANHAWRTAAEDIDEQALAILCAYDWPGNVRELRNAMERAVAVSGGRFVTTCDLPERVRKGAARLGSRPVETGEGPARPTARSLERPGGDSLDRAFRERVRDFELELITDALERTRGNQSRAAELLHMPLRTLVHKIRVLGIKKTYERL